jgi:hypothetical protein
MNIIIAMFLLRFYRERNGDILLYDKSIDHTSELKYLGNPLKLDDAKYLENLRKYSYVYV